MELPLSCIERRVQKIKKNLFSSNFDLYTFVYPSTYDTAWLAVIPHSKYPSQPMFKNYLDWLLNNQKPQGYWGESDTIECLPATIVSMVALKKWNTGTSMVERGKINVFLTQVFDTYKYIYILFLCVLYYLSLSFFFFRDLSFSFILGVCFLNW
jgi:hypothetical protein